MSKDFRGAKVVKRAIKLLLNILLTLMQQQVLQYQLHTEETIFFTRFRFISRDALLNSLEGQTFIASLIPFEPCSEVLPAF